MRPLVLGLRGGPDLVTQGLRTFELCIDNLTHDFLEPILNPHIEDLMAGLWRHLKPEPYNRGHSHMAARILGKLGGYNRRLLKEPPVIDFIHKEPGLMASLKICPDEGNHVVSLDAALDAMCGILRQGDASQEFENEQALEFLRGCLPLLLDTDAGGDDLAGLIQSQVVSYVSNRGKEPVEKVESKDGAYPFPDTPPAPQRMLDAHVETFGKVFSGLIYAAAIPHLKSAASTLIDDIVNHFALLCIAELAMNGMPKPAVKGGKSASSLDAILSTPSSRTDGLVEGIASCIASSVAEVKNIATSTLESFYNVCLSIMGSKVVVLDLKVSF